MRTNTTDPPTVEVVSENLKNHKYQIAHNGTPEKLIFSETADLYLWLRSKNVDENNWS